MTPVRDHMRSRLRRLASAGTRRFGAPNHSAFVFFQPHAMCSSRAGQLSFTLVKRTVSRTTSKA